MKKKVTTPAKKTAKPVSKENKEFKYQVEKGVKIEGFRNGNAFNNFPFELMKVGDSFLIPGNDPVAKNPNVLHYAAKQYARMFPGFNITTRLQLNKDRRVWRLK